MSHPPPLPLRRYISRSLDDVSKVVGNDNRRAPTLPPRPLPHPRPTVAPRPTPRQDPQYEIIDIRQRRNEENPYARLCSPIDSADFRLYNLQTFSKEVKLPKAVEVMDGFCGATEDIPVGYKLMVYFQKTTRVIQAKDQLDTVYNIPLGSSLKFAPIDEKPNKGDYSGFYYDSVEEMLQERPTLPKIVCAKGRFTTTKGKHSINSKDILFPKKIDKSTLRASRVTGIQCTKLGDDEIKLVLPLDCACGFSTATEDIQLYLSEYIKHVNEFPVKVLVFGIDKSMNYGIPTTLILQGEHPLKTLVARSLHSETEIITEISIDLPITVKCLSLDNEVSERKRVKKVYETFNSSRVSTIYSVTKTNAQHKAQQHLYAQIRQEDNTKYYDIIAPENITNSLPDAIEDATPSSPRPSRHKILTHLLKHRPHSTGNDDGDDAASPVRKLKLRNFLPGPGKTKSQSTDTDEEDHKALNQINIDPESLKAEIKEGIKQELESSLREDIRKLRVDNAHCLQQLARLNETIEKLQKQNEGGISSQKPPRNPAPELEEIYKLTPEENRKFLQSLDHIKVLQLLDGMKLEKYKSEFKSSFVDGQLLATLSQTELVELKVNSLLHQRKLLNIIEGSESARKYLLFAEEDPYKR